MKTNFKSFVFRFSATLCFSVEFGFSGTLGDLTYEVVNGEEVTITDCSSAAEGEFIIPDEIEELPVTTIADSAFSRRREITYITIPQSVSIIGLSAFRYCEGLTFVVLPSSLTRGGSQLFKAARA
ncbi:MAG: hypothetical protein ACJAVK_003203 [Akkermansiaceae bacterium]|jgi:hypothetical protein